MTWIVAKVMPGGYAAAISDIRVTIGREHRDCLQKVYRVGRSTALGFAGCPHLGFLLKDALTHTLSREAAPGDSPDSILEWWPTEARRVYELNAIPGQASECQLLLLAAHPTADVKDTSQPRPRCFVYRFSAPQFEPEPAPPDGIYDGETRAVAIGCGNEYEQYRQALENAGQYLTIAEMYRAPPPDFYHFLDSIRRVLINHRAPDVSPSIQYCLVGRDKFDVRDTRATLYDKDKEAEEFSVPKLATNPFELIEALGGLGGIAEARC